jgi:hypothetical protein
MLALKVPILERICASDLLYVPAFTYIASLCHMLLRSLSFTILHVLAALRHCQEGGSPMMKVAYNLCEGVSTLL